MVLKGLRFLPQCMKVKNLLGAAPPSLYLNEPHLDPAMNEKILSPHWLKAAGDIGSCWQSQPMRREQGVGADPRCVRQWRHRSEPA